MSQRIWKPTYLPTYLSLSLFRPFSFLFPYIYKKRSKTPGWDFDDLVSEISKSPLIGSTKTVDLKYSVAFSGVRRSTFCLIKIRASDSSLYSSRVLTDADEDQRYSEETFQFIMF